MSHLLLSQSRRARTVTQLLDFNLQNMAASIRPTEVGESIRQIVRPTSATAVPVCSTTQKRNVVPHQIFTYCVLVALRTVHRPLRIQPTIAPVSSFV